MRRSQVATLVCFKDHMDSKPDATIVALGWGLATIVIVGAFGIHAERVVVSGDELAPEFKAATAQRGTAVVAVPAERAHAAPGARRGGVHGFLADEALRPILPQVACATAARPHEVLDAVDHPVRGGRGPLRNAVMLLTGAPSRWSRRRHEASTTPSRQRDTK